MNITSSVGDVCFTNIGPKERQRRLTIGVVGLAIGLVVFVALRAFATPVWMNVFTLPFFLAAASGFFQWKDKTCVANSMRGVMNMDDGDVKVTDAVMTKALAAQAKRIQIKSLLTALGATALCVFLSVI